MKKFSEWIGPIREAQVNEASELQKSYQEYFKAKLKKYNAESPADLDDETKKKFFNEITQEWERGKGVKPEVKEKIEKEEKDAEEKEKKEPAADVADMEGDADEKMKKMTKANENVNEMQKPKTNDQKAENLVKKIVKSNPRFKWLYDDLSNNYSLEDVEKILNDAGYGNEYDKHVKESENLNEMQKPKSWDTMFAMNAIRDYEEGKFDPENKASLANWEKEYNGGVAPRPGFETYDIIAYALMTGKKPDGSPMIEK